MAAVSRVGGSARSVARWLLTPLLATVDRRIEWRLSESHQRIARTERHLEAVEGYAQLLAGALAPPPPSNSNASDRPPAPPASDGGAAVPIATGPGQLDYLDRLSCPVCRTSVRVVPEVVTADGHVKHGHVPCAVCGEVVARVRDFRVDFRARGGAPPTHVDPPRVIPVLGELRIRFDDDRLTATEGWEPWDDRFLVSRGSIADSIEYRGRFIDALVHLVTHAGGGIVDFFVDGRLTGTADLHSEHWFVMPFTIASDLPFDEHVLRIQPRGSRNAAATAADVHVAELVLRGARTEPGFDEPRPIIRGNPYMEPFERTIAQTPLDQLVLEVGGGERRRGRPGYINLEYLSLEFADVYGDIHHLPFRDDTFGLVLAQAVFEHVTNPFEAAAELVRVTRPGGLIVVDVAFMQPLHAAPYHYFNMTSWGIEELFKSCKIVESDHYDGFASTIDWIMRSAGAQETVTEVEYTNVIDRIRVMESKLSHSNIRPAASGVYVIARKPAGSSPNGDAATAAAQ
jgi:predicted SAM-dependent methyltransferase